MFLTHRLTFSPLIKVRAIATCQMGDSKPRTPWLSIRYPRYPVRNASALVRSSLKIRGRDPIGLMSLAWGMGTWSCKSSPSGSSLGGSPLPPPRSSSSRGPPPPVPLPWGQRRLRKALIRVAQIQVSLGSSQFNLGGRDSLNPPVPPVGSTNDWESC